ncbi:MAG: hypothetical protein KJ621_15890 [Proteobacteria bacterium]|nr:hypothetical protein [Pseudomonadota bacterium]MBU1742502.1 hypothetical protein [Pseudomonadota bacterium]
MKAGIIFTGTGPILILTSYESFTSPDLASKLAGKGVNKYIACEVDIDLCRKRYGQKFEAVLKDVKQQDDIRVLDYNGHNVFYSFAFSELGPPRFVDSQP